MVKLSRLAIALILVSLIIPAIPISTTVKAEKPLVVVIADGALNASALVQLQYMIKNITEVEWKIITDSDEMTFDDIKDAVMLIYVQVDIAKNISDKAVDVIKRWFDQGGKTLWVTGDSDYRGGDYKRIPNANKVLKAVGSHLRNDHAEAVDRESNCGKPYRVAAIIDPDPELVFLKFGVSKPVLFHGPGVIAVEIDGKWYKLKPTGPKPLPTIYRIARTSDKGAIVEFVAPTPHAYEPGEEGSFVLMAAEYFPEKDNLVILSVEAPFDHYRGMWITEYHGVKLDGPQFVKNIVLWGARIYGFVLAAPKTTTVYHTTTMTVTKAETTTIPKTVAAPWYTTTEGLAVLGGIILVAIIAIVVAAVARR